ncbi:hypothetical protein [Paludisphaera rhizosphaerae]|uniref:hypothetical protein n=1 Tax=Paludisphaera rhizosphaerae TaxID=2711216 RepID=UPI0013EC0548|nr:hypothetical protein [Paludisphaera rhizosphaerae]
MKRMIGTALGVSALLVAGLLAGIKTGRLPLGVAGEWEWSRITVALSPLWLLVSAVGVAAYGGYAALGFRALGVPSRRGWRETGWVTGLTASAVLLQVLIATGAPEGYDLTRWGFVHCTKGATGYYDIAREQAASDPWKFLADYPTWIESQDVFHIGTHPPGLIATHALLLNLMGRHPSAADFLLATAPPSVIAGFQQAAIASERTIPRADRAEMYLISLLTLLAAAGAVAPLYLMARESLPPQLAWASAAFWPLAPALNLFQPGADAAYPFFSAGALAAAAWAVRINGAPGFLGWLSILLGVVSGAVMAFGMMYTLAFLPVGLIVALVVLSRLSTLWRRRFATIAWIGVGFLTFVGLAWLITSADPIVVWRWNLHHHARFYDSYPRSYLPWLLINPVELAIAAGIPTALWCLTGALADHRYVPRAAWSAIAVVTLANLTGRNMGEVARLWMIFLPPLLTAAGLGLTRLGGGSRTVFATILLLGIQTLGLQCLIQVVYPF